MKRFNLSEKEAMESMALDSIELSDNKKHGKVLWFNERCYNRGMARSWKIVCVLHLKKTKWQEIFVFQSSEELGNILVSDGAIQSVEKLEYFDSEIYNLALFAHKIPKSVLIIGDSTGAILKEMRRHRILEKIVNCELDAEMVKISQKYFPNFHFKQSLRDKRVAMRSEDGVKYVCKLPNESFDVILSNAPVDPNETLRPNEVGNPFTKENFIRNVYRALKKGGIWFSWEIDKDFNLRAAKKRWANVFHPKNVKIGNYSTLMWDYGTLGCLAARKGDLNEYGGLTTPNREIPKDLLDSFKLYNPKVHENTFTLRNSRKYLNS